MLFRSNFESQRRNRIGICLAARAGSLATDVDYWNGRNRPGGPSPTLFAYTLPSAAIGEIAIRFKLTGPNLCFVGGDESILSEAAYFIRQGEADAVVCVKVTVVSTALEQIISTKPTATAEAHFLKREEDQG